MKLHELKIQKNFADDIVSGIKTFEIRDDDRGFQTGDLIRFTAIEPGTYLKCEHEINEQTYKITYVMCGWGLKNGVVALAIKEVDA
jgi:uncharacterized protein YqfB (UPF0267 family)